MLGADGKALDLVLRAAGEPCRTRLDFSRLTPGATYKVVQTGEAVKAAADGTANLLFNLDSRSELRLVPAP